VGSAAAAPFDLMALEKVSIGQGERALEQVRARKPVFGSSKPPTPASTGRPAWSPPSSLRSPVRTPPAPKRPARTTSTLAIRFLTGNVGGYLIRAPLVALPG
jgi:hypothetical protein